MNFDTIIYHQQPARVEGVGCEATVEAELEDDAGWCGRRGISTAPT
jgi:hypothetical protein